MILYEIDVDSLWWVAANDSSEAFEIFRDELRNREISDEEVDDALDCLSLNPLTKWEAEAIIVVDEFGDATSSLWSMFMSMVRPGLVTCDFVRDNEEDPDEDAFSVLSRHGALDRGY